MSFKILNTLKLAKVFAVLSFLMTNLCYGQWMKKCPEGGSVNCFVKNGTDLFAGTFGGVYKSSDNGATWTLSNSGIDILDIRCMLVTSSKIYAGSSGGIYSSSDGGANWSLCGFANKRIYAMVELNNTIFSINRNDWGVYKSIDGGVTWTFAGLDLLDVRSLHVEIGRAHV